MTIDETRERLIRLETESKHMAEDIKSMQRKVDAMHDLLMKAQGARWLLVGFATMGGAAAAFFAKFLPVWPVR